MVALELMLLLIGRCFEDPYESWCDKVSGVG